MQYRIFDLQTHSLPSQLHIPPHLASTLREVIALREQLLLGDRTSTNMAHPENVNQDIHRRNNGILTPLPSFVDDFSNFTFVFIDILMFVALQANVPDEFRIDVEEESHDNTHSRNNPQEACPCQNCP